MKRIVKLCMILLVTIAALVPISNENIEAAVSPQFEAIHEITRNDGGGTWGTHAKPNYQEGATQYYRDGDIIEVNVKLPAGNNSNYASDVIKYDATKLTMLSSHRDINYSLSSYYEKTLNWGSNVANNNGKSDELYITAYSNDYRILTTKDREGGSIAKIYFRVNAGIETEAGNPITFEFPAFSAGEFDEVLDKVVPTHMGYDPGRHTETNIYKAPNKTIHAKKPSVNFTAKDAFIKQSEAKALNIANDLKVYNEAIAALSDGSPLEVSTTTTEFTTIKSGKLGTYNITYKNTYNGITDTKVVKLSVISDSSEISVDKTVALDAHNAFITQTEAKALPSQNALINLSKASVKLSDGTTATPIISAPSYSSIKAGVIGTYSVTYRYGTGLSAVEKTVLVSVVRDGSITAPDQSASLFAKNGTIKETVAKNLATKEELAPFNNAEVTLINGSIVAPKTTISQADWLGIKAGTKGFYNVLYSYGTGDNEISKAVTIQVLGDGGVVSPDGSVTIDAENVELTQTEAKKLVNQNSLLSVNKVLASKDTNGVIEQVIPTISAPLFSNIKLGIVGNYAIKYSYGSGSSYAEITVYVNVVKDKVHEIITHNAFITEDQAKALSTKEELRIVNNVVVNAIDGSHPEAVVTAPEWAAMKGGTHGTYNVVYGYGFGDKYVSKTAVVTIVPNDSAFDKHASLAAKSSFITQSEAKALASKEALIGVNKAKVTLIDGTVATPEVTILSAEWNLLKGGDLGVYDVTYSYQTPDKKLQKHVTVTVIKDGSNVSEDGTVSLVAEDGFITSSDAKKVATQSQLRPYNSVQVTLVDGSNVDANVTVNTADWLAIKQGKIGAYDVLYTYGTGVKYVEKTVKLVVVGDNVVISPDKSTALNAKSGQIPDNKAMALTSKEELLAYNEAVVTMSKDGSTHNPAIYISTQSWNAIRSGTLGVYSVTYTYGTEGTNNFVSKTVTIEVIKVTEEVYLFDYNNDSIINIQDFVDFIRIYNTAGKNASERDFMLSDSNGDGIINGLDLLEIRYFMANQGKKPNKIHVPL